MSKESTGRILNRIFKESEKGTLSSEELEIKLVRLGVNPDLLVKKGLQKINNCFDIDKKLSMDSYSKLESGLLAAKKSGPDSNIEEEIRKIEKKNKKN